MFELLQLSTHFPASVQRIRLTTGLTALRNVCTGMSGDHSALYIQSRAQQVLIPLNIQTPTWVTSHMTGILVTWQGFLTHKGTILFTTVTIHTPGPDQLCVKTNGTVWNMSCDWWIYISLQSLILVWLDDVNTIIFLSKIYVDTITCVWGVI